MESKNQIFEKLIKDSFDVLLTEIRKSNANQRDGSKSSELNMVQDTPLTGIRPYMFDILEIICSFLIKIIDSSGKQGNGLFFPKKIFAIQSDLLTQYEFELTPEILKQIYFEYQFFFEMVNSYLWAYQQIDQKAEELAQKLLQMIVKANAMMEGKKVMGAEKMEERDVFSEVEMAKMEKSLRSLKLIHEYNFCVLSIM